MRTWMGGQRCEGRRGEATRRYIYASNISRRQARLTKLRDNGGDFPLQGGASDLQTCFFLTMVEKNHLGL